MAFHAALFSSSLSFSFVVLRTDSLVEGLSSFNSCGNSASADVCGEFPFSFSFLPQLFFSASLTLRYCNAVLSSEI